MFSFSYVFYVSARTPLCLDLAMIYVSLGLRYFPVTSSRDFVDICFMFYLSLFPMFPSRALCLPFHFLGLRSSPQPYLIVLRLDYSDLELVSRSGASAL